MSFFHLSLAYFFINAPQKIADQNIVLIFGAAMNLPRAKAFMHPSATSAFLGLIMGFLGITDLTAVSLPEEIALYHWGNQGIFFREEFADYLVRQSLSCPPAPIRLLMFFGIVAYTYIFKPGGMGSSSVSLLPGYTEGLANSVVFTWAFIEMVSWFWIYVTLRDQRRESAIRLMEKRRAEEESL
ncbi:MAG: hypothetical protein M1817_004415 [Caeruleum heppii]|nr:MAG: hypothetical protein M1817_004415 [Caeruleum heppii]